MSTAAGSKATQELLDLIELFPEVIGHMRGETFTSHEFILELANRHQEHYVQALCRYSKYRTPFRNLHSQISSALNDFPALLENVGDVKSEDIFRKRRTCASWRKKG